MNSIEHKKAQRLRFMGELYDAVDGREGSFADKRFLDKLGLDLTKKEDFDEFQSTAEFLTGEGLITTIHTKDHEVTEVRLTHKGAREVEEARSRPDEPTEHFAPVNIVFANAITNSPIQQSSPGATQSLHVLKHDDLQQLKTFLQDLRGEIDGLGLDNDQRAEIEADVRTVEEQVNSPRPKQEIIQPSLSSIRRILEGSASAAIASPLTATVTALINNLSV